MRLALSVLATFSLLALFPARASAHQHFVGIIDQTLDVNVAKILPNNGCLLCHTSDGGSTATLRPFGELMVSKYGLAYSPVENDVSLTAALQGLQMGDPQLVADLKMGTDPNNDVVNDPTPAYGCTAAPGAVGGASLALVAIVAASLVGVRRRWGRPTA
jgi:hypothetical protein